MRYFSAIGIFTALGATPAVAGTGAQLIQQAGSGNWLMTLVAFGVLGITLRCRRDPAAGLD